MAIAVASTSTTTWAVNSDCVLTKPAGLSVGDLMIACVIAEDDTVNTLSGWTELQEASSGANQLSTSLQYKVADSGDVAASNFTFVRTNADGDTAGAIFRITGYAPTALFSDSETEVDLNSATQIDAGVTLDPITNGELIIVASGIRTLSAAGAVSSPTINGTNPTWTEVLDVSEDYGGGNYVVAYVAYAIQTTQAQITSFTATVTNTSASTDGTTVIATLSPLTNVTGTFTPLENSSTLVAPVAKSGVTGTITPLTNESTLVAPTAKTFNNGAWSNPTKPSTTWTNPDKP